MSEATPPPEAPQPQPEGSEPDAGHARGSRRVLVVAAVAAVVVLLLGGAAIGAYQYLNGGGPRPEDALPASTIGMISVDLDPKAGQKIEAIKTLRKFPALRKSLGIESEDDLRRYIVDEGLAELCDGLDYAKDVKPWIGKRVAFAGVDLGDEYPAPVLMLQVSDADKAEKGFQKLIDCGGGAGDVADDFGFAVGDDYLVASDSAAHARKILDAGAKKSLADDKDYQRWTDEAGGSGIVNFYIAPGAGKFISSAFEGLLGDLPGFAEGFQSQLEAQGLDNQDPDELLDALDEGLKKFKGAAGALRFADGGMELVFVGQSGNAELGSDPVGKSVAKLPADTALAIGLSVPDGLVDQLLTQAEAQGVPGVESFVQDVEAQTGLRLPEDLQTLLGSAISLSIGGDAPGGLEDFDDPEKVPVGLVLHGDPDAALDVIGKAEDSLGMKLADIPIVAEKGDGSLALSPSSAYAESLTKSGKLGESKLFERAVPDVEHAQFLFFLAIDAGWRDAIVDLAGDGMSAADAEELRDNLAPFGAFGLSSTVVDGVGRFQLRIATR